MPAQKPSLPPTAQPTRSLFDPWNSSATGHQRAEDRISGSTSWRESRTYKLGHQFRDGSGTGGGRLSDLSGTGTGSEGSGVDGRMEGWGWESGECLVYNEEMEGREEVGLG